MKIGGISDPNINLGQSKTVGEQAKTPAQEIVKLEDKNMSNQSFPGEKQLIDAIERANKDVELSNNSLKFSIHEKTKQIVVKVIDNNTKEVVREFPSEKILNVVAEMMERTGLFVDKTV